MGWESRLLQRVGKHFHPWATQQIDHWGWSFWPKPVLLLKKQNMNQKGLLFVGCVNILAKKVYLRSRSASTISCVATLTYKLQIKFAISSSLRMLTLGKPVPPLIPKHQTSHRITTRAPILGHRYDCHDSRPAMVFGQNEAIDWKMVTEETEDRKQEAQWWEYQHSSCDSKKPMDAAEYGLSWIMHVPRQLCRVLCRIIKIIALCVLT